MTGNGTGGPDPALRNLRVLLVDDDALVLEVMALALEAMGARVVTATSADQALSAFRREAPHVVVSDLGMPGEDGYALMQKIRALPPEDGGRVPAIALTGYVRRDDETRALAAGYQVHFSKPVESAELAAAIDRLARDRTP